jgi:ferredoxin-type protein NapH
MKKQFSKKTFFRIIIEIFFLTVYIFFTFTNSQQKWMVVLITGIALSLFFSRVYCGWMCQMNTVFRSINWVYGKLGIKRPKTPLFFKHKAFKYIILVIILLSLILTMKLRIKVNLTLYVSIIGIVATLFLEESFWHNYICPYGTIQSFSSRPAKLSVKIDEDNCKNCGTCQKVCPAEAIKTLDSKKRRVTKNLCLTCFKCQEVCPPKVITYRT